MRRTLLRTAALLFLIVLLACAENHVKRLTKDSYPPKSDPAEVRLYLNDAARSHEKIAYINSFLDPERSDEVKRRQLADLRIRAAELGADAVTNVRLLCEKNRGLVVDERVPFESYRQGDYELYFLRGTAIVYTPDADGEAPAASDADSSATTEAASIPEVDSKDAAEDLEHEPTPGTYGGAAP